MESVVKGEGNDMGLVETVHSTLEAFEVDDQVVQEILRMLERSERDVRDGKVRRSAEGAFGGAESGQVLSWDAGTAHGKVTEAMAQMVAGLQGYADNLRVFREDAARSDDEAAGALQSLNTLTAQISSPNIAAAGGSGTTSGAAGGDS